MTVKFKIKCFDIYNVVIVLFGSDLCFCLLKSVQQISACVSQWQSHSHWVRTRDCFYIRLCESVWCVITAIFTHYYQWIWAQIYQSADKGTHSDSVGLREVVQWLPLLELLLEPKIYIHMRQNTVMLHVGGGPKFFCQIFRLIPNSMFIIRWEIVIWGVRTTKKPQIWPYFGPKAYNEVNWRIWNIKFNLQLEEHFWVQIPSVIPFRNRLVIPNLEI